MRMGTNRDSTVFSHSALVLSTSRELKKLSEMIGVLNRHFAIETHVVRLHILEDATCQSFNEEDEVETSRYFFLLFYSYLGVLGITTNKRL